MRHSPLPLVAVLLFLAHAAPLAAETTVTIPIVLSSSGGSGSFFTSELTLTNRGALSGTVTFSYTAAFGGQSGQATDTLAAGTQRIVPDAIAYLKGLGIPVGDSGNRGGTLRVDLPGTGSATVRTTTAVPDGRAGLAYAGLPASRLLSGPVYLCGLRQNASDRSNVAVLNAGAATDGAIVMRLTVISGSPAQPGSLVLPLITLQPGGFEQVSGVLASNGLSLTNGYVEVERVSGTAPWAAYAVINDQANSDGSYVEPVAAAPVSAIVRLTLPVIVETPAFSSELVVTNFSPTARTLHVTWVASALTGGLVSFDQALLPHEQQILPSFVQLLRSRGVVTDPAGPTFTGALFVTDATGDLRGVSVAARSSTAGGGGRYGLFCTAVPAGAEAATSAWLYDLQQDANDRTNLALVNVGSFDASTDTFRIDLFDGATGARAAAVNGVSVPPMGFLQLNAILQQYAPGIPSGYALATRTGGHNPFLAYAVINDGGSPGARSGDGAFVLAEMSPNLAANPHFDGDATGWQLLNGAAYDSGSDTGAGRPGSGSVLATFTGDGAVAAATQCAPATPGVTYGFGESVLIPAGLPVKAVTRVSVDFWTGADCKGSIISGQGGYTNYVGPVGAWTPISGSVVAPSGAASANLILWMGTQGSGTIHLNLDDAFLAAGPTSAP